MPEIVLTADGSTSVYNIELNEHYHSTHGALQESMHVFIQAGLQAKLPSQSELSILEIGFGTGLNALLTAIEACAHQQKIKYISIEKFPLDITTHQQLNYCSLINKEECSQLYTTICQCEWQQPQYINEYFTLEKINMDIHHIQFNNTFDIIYFDAFSPTSQPELWTGVIFQTMYHALKDEGILVTYCAKGEVKRTLKATGFLLETLSGPKGKREMIRAVKK